MNTLDIVSLTNERAQYDEYAKSLIKQRRVLAHLLKATVSEFKSMSLSSIMKCFEGEPYISVPVEPGMTNKKADGKVIELNTEDGVIGEGIARFDILFYVRIGESLAKMIINVEIQRKESSQYDILNRALFYMSREISSQKERDFTGSDYNSIKKVYSIWIMLNEKNCSLNYYGFECKQLVGSKQWKGDLGKANIVVIGVTNEIPSGDSKKLRLHRLLSALLSRSETVERKNEVLRDLDFPERDIEHMKGEFEVMCNLSEDIFEDGLERGIEKGVSKERIDTVRRLIHANCTKEFIFSLGYTDEEYAEAEKELLATV